MDPTNDRLLCGIIREWTVSVFLDLNVADIRIIPKAIYVLIYKFIAPLGLREAIEYTNDMVEKFREKNETMETIYEEEFKEFERMANHKVVCDSVYVNDRKSWLVTNNFFAGPIGGVLCTTIADEGAAVTRNVPQIATFTAC